MDAPIRRRHPLSELRVPDDSPGPNDSATLGFVESLYDEAKKEKKRVSAKWPAYHKLVHNDSWSPLRSAALPAPQSSEVWPTFACVPEEAEALTLDGWKTWDQITPESVLLTYKTGEDRFEWQKALRVSVYEFEGKLQDIRGFLATEDHRWPVRSSQSGKHHIRRGYDLKYQDQLIRSAGSHEFPEESILSPRDAAILGWLLTDGVFEMRGPDKPWGLIYQARSNYYREIVDLLQDEATHSFRTCTLSKNPKDQAVFYVRTAMLRRLVAAGFRSKKEDLIPIITRLSHEAAEAMWDAMMKADGSATKKGNAVFCQNPGPVFDAFQVLSTLLGFPVSCDKRYKHPVSGFNSGRVRNRTGHYWFVQETSYEHYEGRIWCPTTPNDTWVMRYNNEVVVTGNTLIAYLLDQYPQCFVSPDPDLRYFSTAPPVEILQEKSQDMQDILSSWWVTSGAHATAAKTLWDTLTFGTGIAETGFDPLAGRGQGQVFWRWVDPFNFLPDPNASGLEDAAYLVKVTPSCPMFEIKTRFPERGHLVKPDIDNSPGKNDSRPRTGGGSFDVVSQTGAIDRTGVHPGTTGTSTGARWAKAGENREDYTGATKLIECWVRNTERLEIPHIGPEGKVSMEFRDFAVWEYIACAGGVVMNEDTSNPFEHGDQPFERLPMVQMGGEFWAMSMTQHLRSNATAINRLLAAMQRHAEICGNPIFVEPEASGIGTQKIVNRPGQRLSTNIAATNLIRWLDPPNMSPAVMQLLGWHRDSIDRSSGISAVARGSQLRRREPAAAVDAVQEASFVRIRDLLRNYEEFLRGVHNKTCSNVVQFMTDARAVPIIGPRGAEKTITLGPKHFWVPQFDPATDEALDDEPIRFTCHVQAGSSQPLSRQARAAEADMLRQGGGLDLVSWLQAHDWHDPEGTAEKVREEQGMVQQAEQMQQLQEKAQGG